MEDEETMTAMPVEVELTGNNTGAQSNIEEVETPGKKDKLTNRLNEGMDAELKKGSPTIPAKPAMSITPEGRKYRLLNVELNRKFVEQGKKLEQIQKERDDLSSKHAKFMTEHDHLKEKYYVLMKKDEEVVESTKESTPNNLEFVLNQHQSILKEKDEQITLLKEKIQTMEAETVCCLKKVTSEEDMFKIKPKTSSRMRKDDDQTENRAKM